ncbi:MAG: (2Fe-2S)-binding protein [Burkholderiales bacterium]
MQRREFIKRCAAGAAFFSVSPGGFADPSAKPQFYQRVKLLDVHNASIRAGQLAVNRNYIFHYPYAGTPCFLLNLGKSAGGAITLKTEDGKLYQWPGGVGASRSIVGYSAICAHRLAYPTRQISFISFRPTVDKNSHATARTIHCCAEHSEYDPASGGRVLGGPAKQPLAAILLEHDAKSDELFAVGTLGGELFNAFFEKYDFKLQLEHGPGARKPVANSVIVTELNDFCQQEVRC